MQLKAHFLQGSMATKLRKCGKFNSSFYCNSFLNSTGKN